jgi:hypothetical protein
MIHRREVRAEGHVVEVVVRLRRSELRVNKLAIPTGKRDAAFLELRLQSFELREGEVVAETAGAAVREVGHVPVP